jgi:DNA repair protein RecO (recombination protein O)
MKPAEHIRTVEAVIISHKDFGEADRLVTLFSREVGKIRGMAKGVRKMGSRKAAYLEPFMHSRVVLAKGKTFWILTQADGIKQYVSIPESLEKTGRAAYVVELAERFTVEEEPSPQLFNLIIDTLDRIDASADTFAPTLFFELCILDHAGFRPDLTDCVGCGRAITAQDQFFAAEQGGVVCPRCGGLYQHMRRISMDALRYLRHFQRNDFSALMGIDVPQVVRQEILSVMGDYLSRIVERRLNAPEFMRQIAHSGNENHNVK